MKKRVILSEKAVAAIQEHGREAYPYECCGFLYGTEKAERRIEQAVRVPNSKEGDQRRRFEISPADYLWAERYALEKDLQLFGVYHSHPNHPAIASETDLAMAMPYFSYVIISVNDGIPGDIKSWQLADNDRRFEEEEVWLEQTEDLSTDFVAQIPCSNNSPKTLEKL